MHPTIEREQLPVFLLVVLIALPLFGLASGHMGYLIYAYLELLCLLGMAILSLLAVIYIVWYLFKRTKRRKIFGLIGAFVLILDGIGVLVYDRDAVIPLCIALGLFIVMVNLRTKADTAIDIAPPSE